MNKGRVMKATLWGGLCAGVLLLTSASAQILKPLPPIRTASGIVAGKVLASGVKAWLGVPFAKPPVNDLRWMPPQPIAWQGVWNADRKMPECMQVLRPHDINHYFGEEATGEDCLYLNVWAPPRATASSKLPVIVFYYGGGGTIGSAGSGMYDGEAMAKKGAIFVTIAYRLGILGYMAHPELTREQGGHSGNYAGLDQLAGLEWVHDNIARFGGDPAHVAITGQSAGAGAVSTLIHAPLAKGLFQAAMMSSTCSLGAGSGGATLAEAEQTGLDIQKRLGVSSLKQMRDVAADKLVALQNESQVGYRLTGGVRVGPIIDGYFTPASKLEMMQSHRMSDIPVIANFNSGESSSPLQAAKTAADYRQIAAHLYGDASAEFLRLYPVSSDAEVAPMAAKVAREASIANASRNCGVMQAQYNKSPVFIDMYDRKHPYTPGVAFADQDPATVGAYHNADIVYWFGNQDQFNRFRPTRNWTAWDRTLAGEMAGALIAFARTGNPTTAAVKWPAWSAQNDAYVRFGDNVTVERFNAQGMQWLAAHPVAGGGRGGRGAPGIVAGRGPRD